jgi:transcription elongation factor GreA
VVEQATGGVVGLGSVVEVEDEASGTRTTYTLVSSHDADAAQGRLSVESPVAAGLLGRRAGDLAAVSLPRGEKRLKLLSVG